MIIVAAQMSKQNSEFAYLAEKAIPYKEKTYEGKDTISLKNLIKTLQTLEKKFGEDTPVWISTDGGIESLRVFETYNTNEIVLATYKL